MLFLAGVLFMVVGIALSIALHEIGHLVPAKRFGVRVPQYMVGFGPTIASFKRGETEYGVKAIPLGGYVKLIGMYPPAKDGAPAKGRFASLIEDARAVSLEEVGPEDHNRVFYALSAPKKIIVMLGGPMMNFIIGVVLLTGVLTLHGTYELGTTLSRVVPCVDAKNANREVTDCKGAQQGAAEAAGLKAGDHITAINGQPTSSWDQLREVVQNNPSTPLSFAVTAANGQERTLSLTPSSVQAYQLDPTTGDPLRDAQGKLLTHQVGYIGAAGTQELVKQSVPEAFVMIGDQIKRVGSLIITLPEKMVGVFKASFAGAERDPEGPASVVGVTRTAGEVASTPTVGPPSDRVAMLISMLGGLNLVLCIFNLLPLVPLDGGHILGASYEGARRAFARLLRRPNPGLVDVAKMLPVAYVVGSAFIAMTLLLVYADVVNPIDLLG